MVKFEDFKKLDIRIADIVEAMPHPQADKLYVLKIKVGDEERQIVAGIRRNYSAEELKGRKIVVVNNLEPAVIRGVESRGMLLAASEGDKISLLIPDQDLTSGSQVK